MAIQLLAANSARLSAGDLSALAGPEHLTVAVTVKCVGDPAAGAVLLSQWNDADGSSAFSLYVQDPGDGGELGGLLFEVTDGTNDDGYATTGLQMVAGGTYRIVLRWHAGVARISVNAVPQSVITAWGDTPVSALPNAAAPVDIGRTSLDGYPGLDADYSEVAIWSRELTDAEVAEYGAGDSPASFPADGIFYLRATDLSHLTDEWGSVTVVNTGGTLATHPAVVYPPPASIAWGVLAPTSGETPLSWERWETAVGVQAPITGDPNWGQIDVVDGTPVFSSVVDMGDASTKTVTVALNTYGTGSGGVTLGIRGSATPFTAFDVAPAWIPYTAPVTHAWRYVQVRATYSPSM
jgi:hypothetical protein